MFSLRSNFFIQHLGVFSLVGLLLTQPSVLRAESMFFADGQTTWRICVAEASEPTVLYAVEELTNALKKISGIDFPVQTGDEVPTNNAIIIGDLTHPLVQQNTNTLGLTPSTIEQTVVKTIGGQLFLAGNQPRAALYAVYTFLNHELDVRWLWPGDAGEFMPARAQYALPEIDYKHVPGYTFRGLHRCTAWKDHPEFLPWMARNFVNIHRDAAPESQKRLGIYSMYSHHNVFVGSKYFAKHPEYFAENDGKRVHTGMCMSHPDVLPIVVQNLRLIVERNPQLEILSLFPADNRHYCRCEKCSQTDPSTTWFNFYNKITDVLAPEFPSLKFSTIAYQDYDKVPDCELRNTYFVEYTTLCRCHAHPFSDTNCPLNQPILKDFDAWKKVGLPIGHYAYEFALFQGKYSRFYPFFTMIEDAIRDGHRRQLISLITEVAFTSRTKPMIDLNMRPYHNRLPIYIYTQLMWDPARSADELLTEWCQTVYGDAAEPMLGYFRAMDKAWTAMTYHPDILLFDWMMLKMVDTFITDDLRVSVKKSFDAAETALAKQTPSPARDRALEAFEIERVLYQQWLDLADQKRDETSVEKKDH